MDEEKEYADNYEIVQSCTIGRSRIVVGEDMKSEQPFFLANAKRWFMGWQYSECIVSKDYLEICTEFIQRQKTALEQIRKEREERHSDGIPYDASVCIPESWKQNYKNQILVLKPSYLAPQFRIKEEQLVLGEGGFGCDPSASGTKVYCRDCYTGEQFYVPRHEVMGIMKPDCVPPWAAENAAIFRAQSKREKEHHQDR